MIYVPHICLCLAKNEINTQGAYELIAALKKAEFLATLNLSRNNCFNLNVGDNNIIASEEFNNFTNSIKEIKKLTWLDISNKFRKQKFIRQQPDLSSRSRNLFLFIKAACVLNAFKYQ